MFSGVSLFRDLDTERFAAQIWVIEEFNITVMETSLFQMAVAVWSKLWKH